MKSSETAKRERASESPLRPQENKEQEENEKRQPKPHRKDTAHNTNSTAADKRNVDWANTIKSHHERLRKRIGELGGDAERVWGEVTATATEQQQQQQQQQQQTQKQKQDDDDDADAALRSYADAMYRLATCHWTSGPRHSTTAETEAEEVAQQRDGDVTQSGEGGGEGRTPRPPVRHDDRIDHVLKLLTSYFIGKKKKTEEIPSNGEGGSEASSAWEYEQIPQLVSIPLKQRKRAYFEEHKQGMPSNLVQTLAKRALLAREAPLRLLDVGSCFNPFAGLCIDEWTNEVLCTDAKGNNGEKDSSSSSSRSCRLLDVTAVDLCPALPFNECRVHTGDWLKMGIVEDALAPPLPHPGHSTLSSSQAGSSNSSELTVLPASSFDAIVFCLLLSYMPTPEMRLRAVIKACNALKPHGLLVIVSTKTQGTRKSGWIATWTKVITSIGSSSSRDNNSDTTAATEGCGCFLRVHQVVLHQLVILSFAKKSQACNDANDLFDGATANSAAPPLLDEETELLWFRQQGPSLQMNIAADEDGKACI